MMKLTQGRNLLRSGSRAATVAATRTAMFASTTITITTSSRLASTSRSFAVSTAAPQNNFKYDAPWFHYSEHSKEPHVMNFINGSFEPVTVSNDDVVSSSSIPLFDPSSNKVLSYVPESHHPSQQMDNDGNESTTALNRAVAAAKQAYPAWSNTPVQSRQRLMLDYAHFLHRKEVREEIAYWITLENGKTTADAMGDVWRGLEVVEAATRVGCDMLGDSLQNLSSGLDTTSYRVPLGVCAGIAPFNFPAMIALWMYPLAIAAGNTYVLKPTEKAPSASILLTKYLHDLGLPPGVVNTVNGSKDTVDGILTHPDVKAISFVGSNRAGEYIHDVGSRNGKRVQANLGAKNHATVLMEDADRESTIKAIVGAAFGAAGQRCMALSVVVLVGDLEESRGWVQEIVEQAKVLKVGNGFVEGVDVGPLISKDATERAENIIQHSIDEGATCLLDGRGITVDGFEDGNFLGPTVVSLSDRQHIDPDQPITNPAYAEEIFAPVLTVLAVPTLDDAISISNENAYGNGTAIFTTSGGAARKYQYEIEAGQVGINVPIPVPLPFFSFTGNKNSIRGDVNFYGKSGVNFFTQLKTVTSNWQYGKGGDLGGVTMPVLGKK
eukprot:CAMPEP_0196130578 /NCGR_PEP_ID=MMETSP0910-20130528/902_1 /TAXON_ID=49265 /ORGANISM="Thalassiosira rotula, Strain GSO102" /LENGTH=607 /DNA_ID=CAMNT_0041389915 /DNA_START=97 /DNA_END=1920 /DNA_ORIENTATION=-